MKKNKYRTDYCGTVKGIGEHVVLSGWVENIRDHGGVLFLDLRDEKGVVQLVSNDATLFSSITRESVIQIDGIVRARKEEDYNLKLETGKIEVVVEHLTILSKAKNMLPFEIISSKEVNEDIRLKYRYLDMRNKKVHDKIQLRSDVLRFIRNKMDDLQFTEVQTPILTASSPEGARDFLVPSRNFKGKFYALPQAPQIFKQLLMVGGIDRYYQIAPCFRDEDGRSDRTLEFYQLDFEMAFATEEDVYQIGEDIFYDIFTHFTSKKVSKKPFVRIPYQEAMLKYGTDKPDLRNPLVIVDITSALAHTLFKPFQNSIIRGIRVDNLASKSNAWFNDLVAYAKTIDMPGIGYITVEEDGSYKGPIDKFLTDEERKAISEQMGLQVGSVLFFIASPDEKVVAKWAGLIRTELARRLDLINQDEYIFCIIHDFPMFTYNKEEKKYDFGHNPFSMPKGGMEVLQDENLENIIAHQYDFVCNGYEMASGAVRNHDLACLKKAFSVVGYDENTVQEKFGALYHAFQFGAPPHAGMAPGIDRILMLLTDESNLREVQTFPASVSGQDFLMGSPSSITEQQLREVHIKLR